MKAFFAKLKSRKFLVALAGIIVGVALISGADSGAITAVSGAVTALASVVSYILTEGRIDAAAVGQAAVATQKAIDAVNGQSEEADNGNNG